MYKRQGYSGVTSTTSVTPASTGTITLTTNQQGAFVTGDRVRAINTVSNLFEGVVTITGGTTFAIAADYNLGTTTAASWTVTITGVRGVQGTTGIQGVQGTTGTQGTTGIQGTQGTTGIQGVQGTTGIQGVQGTTGTQGTTGIQGVQGTTGIQGVQGTTGTQGTTGIDAILTSSTTQSLPTSFPSTLSFVVSSSNTNSIFGVGSRVRAYNYTNTNQYTEGVITSYSGTTLLLQADTVNGGPATGITTWQFTVGGTGATNTQILFTNNSTSNGSPNLTYNVTTSSLYVGPVSTPTLYANVASGYVGLGTNNPSLQLDVYNAATSFVRTYGANVDVRIGQFSSAVSNSGIIGTWTLNPLVFYMNAIEAMRVDVGGNVAINTTNPQAKLEIDGTTSNTVLLFKGAGGGSGYMDYQGSGTNYIDANIHYFRTGSNSGSGSVISTITANGISITPTKNGTPVLNVTSLNASVNAVADVIISRPSAGTGANTGPSIAFNIGGTSSIIQGQGSYGTAIWNYIGGLPTQYFIQLGQNKFGFGTNPASWFSPSLVPLDIGAAGTGIWGSTTIGGSINLYSATYLGGTGQQLAAATNVAGTQYTQSNGSHTWYNTGSYLNSAAGSGVTLNPVMSISANNDISGRGVSLVKYKGSNTSVTASTTLTTDANLVLSLAAGAIYEIEALLLFYGANTGMGLKWAFSGGTATINASSITSLGSVNKVANTGLAPTVYNTGNLYAAVTTTAAASDWLRLQGYVTVNAAGTFPLQWAQNTSNVGSLVMLQGSYLKATQLS